MRLRIAWLGLLVFLPLLAAVALDSAQQAGWVARNATTRCSIHSGVRRGLW